ncbi:hypothetical protein FRC00_001907 [Tulasnella sp. 408]|nr:hypothetical protein FRC00_001907 [Tulasnella sp. 408]
MVTIVKLLTNQDAAVSDADLKAPHLPTAEYISLSDSTVIGFLSPFTTAFLGRIILKEAFSRKEAYAATRPSFLFGHPTEIDPTADTHHLAAGSADGGIVHGVGGSSQNHIEQSEEMRLIAVWCVLLQEHPDVDVVSAYCVLMNCSISLLGVVGLSLAFISMRRLKDSIHVMHSVIYFTAWSLIISAFYTVLSNVIPGIPEASKIVWLWPDFKQFMGIIAIGILGFAGQVLVTMGFQKETAGRGTLALYISSSKRSDNSASPTTEADEEVGLMPIGSESDDDDDEATLRGNESNERLPKAEGLK